MNRYALEFSGLCDRPGLSILQATRCYFGAPDSGNSSTSNPTTNEQVGAQGGVGGAGDNSGATVTSGANNTGQDINGSGVAAISNSSNVTVEDISIPAIEAALSTANNAINTGGKVADDSVIANELTAQGALSALVATENNAVTTLTQAAELAANQPVSTAPVIQSPGQSLSSNTNLILIGLSVLSLIFVMRRK